MSLPGPNKVTQVLCTDLLDKLDVKQIKKGEEAVLM